MKQWYKSVMGLLSCLLLVMALYWHYSTRSPVIVRELSALPITKHIDSTSITFTTMGKASCSGIACHGGASFVLDDSSTQEARWPSSYIHWETFDPHRQAFQSLQTNWAKTILQGLAGPEEKKQPLDHFKPENEQRCLACHTNPSLAHAQPMGVEAESLPIFRAEGVSCEACHGNASNWLNDHTTWSMPESRKNGFAKTGMIPLHEAGKRALSCAGCHVGGPADKQRGFPVRDVNHDMLAAGHPRLYFEYTSFVKRLPPHWREKNRDLPGAPVRSSEEKVYDWFAGQLATTEAFLRLCSDRAERSQHGVAEQDRASWPELALFKCYSCHQSVNGSAKRENSSGLEHQRAGRLHWAMPMPASLSHQLLQWQPESRLVAVLDDMQSGKIIRSEIATAQFQQAAELLRGYRERLARLPAAIWQMQLLTWVIAGQTDAASWDWEEYSTRYASLIFLLESHGALPRLKQEAKAALERKLADLAQTLRFPADSQAVFASPNRWDRQKTAQCYQAVIDAIKQIVPAE